MLTIFFQTVYHRRSSERTFSITYATVVTFRFFYMIFAVFASIDGLFGTVFSALAASGTLIGDKIRQLDGFFSAE